MKHTKRLKRTSLFIVRLGNNCKSQFTLEKDHAELSSKRIEKKRTSISDKKKKMYKVWTDNNERYLGVN